MSRVVVVGGGLSGLSAACELLERGCSVTIIEKMPNLGGISSKATTGIAAPGCSLQGATKDDGAELLKMDGNERSREFLQRGTQDLEWLTKKLAVDSELVLRLTPGHTTARTVGTKTHFPGAVITYAAKHVLEQVAERRPDLVEIVLSAEVTSLIKDGDKVKGVEYRKDGSAAGVTINGHVILATGGYSGDRSSGSVLGKHAAGMARYPTTSDDRASGDALRLGAVVNAGTASLDQVQLTPMSVAIPGSEDGQFKFVISDALPGAGAKLIGKDGQRFTDERSSNQARVGDMEKQRKAPYRLVITEAQAASCKWLVDFYANNKFMKSYSCAGDLAREMGVARLDPQIPASGKIFVATVTPSLYTCTGGLLTGSQAHAGKVLSQSGVPIDGLYAAGEATAKGFAKLWSVSGIPLLWAVSSGRAAATTAAGIVHPGAQPQDLRDIIISSMTAPTEDLSTKASDKKGENGGKADEKPVESMSKDELLAKVKDLMANGPPAVAAGPVGITMEEVKKHNKAEDGWIVVNGNVIDVTKWIDKHPGGREPVLAYLGMDASDEWNSIHRPQLMQNNLVKEGGDGPWEVGKVGNGAAAPAVGGGGDGGLKMADVKGHNTEADCWVVVNGKAYDVTKWLQVHPGGVQAITAFAGQDASDEWNAIHKPGTIEKNLFPGNANGPVDKGAVSDAGAAAPVTGPVDDEAPAPQGNGGIKGPIGAVIFLIKNIVLMLLRTIFFTGNFKINNDRKGTIRSACFLLTFTIIHVAGNFVGMLKGPMEANGEGYFFDRLAWTGGFGIWKEGPAGLSAVELYLAFALLLHVSVALVRSWEISMNYCLGSGRWNMMLSGLTILTFLTVHLYDLRFSPYMTFTELRPPPNFVAFDGVLEGRVFYETDPSIPLVRARDLYTREVEIFKSTPHAVFYTVCIVVFWYHMIRGWEKLVPADAMQIPKDHVYIVKIMGWVAATGIVSMYLSVVWVAHFAIPQHVHHVA